MGELAIVALTRAHLPALEAILRATPEFSVEEVAVALEVLTDALDTGDYGCIVAARSGQVMGYAVFGATPMTERAFDLYWIAVAPAAKRGGVGRALVDAVLAEITARRGGILRVETEGGPSYAATRAFYERLAFETAGEIRDFYGPGRSLVVFVKYL